MTVFQTSPDSNHLQGTKQNVTKKTKIAYLRADGIVWKEENAWYPAFFPFPKCFQTFFSMGCFKSGLCSKGLRHFSEDF